MILMKRKNEQSLQEVMQDILKKYQLNRKFQEAEIGQVWNDILGPSVAKQTRKVNLFKGTLTVYLESGLVKQELNMLKSRLIASLNEHIGRELVKEIILK